MRDERQATLQELAAGTLKPKSEKLNERVKSSNAEIAEVRKYPFRYTI
jgi:hypothetical protein